MIPMKLLNLVGQDMAYTQGQQEAQGHEAASGNDAGFQAWFVSLGVQTLNWKAVMS